MPSKEDPKKGFVTHPRFLDGKSPGENRGDMERRSALAEAVETLPQHGHVAGGSGEELDVGGAHIAAVGDLGGTVIPAERLWVNPDCGLKTRQWPETRAAIATLVAAARRMRAKVET